MKKIDSSVTTVVDVLRHGEPRGGAVYRGQADHPLSERGWRQMWRAVADEPPWQAVVSSSLSRCAEFARELAARRDLPLYIEPALREIGFGDWEGMSAAEIRQRDPLALERYWADPIACTPPGGESFADFRRRVLMAWEELLRRLAGRQWLLVAHGGVIRLLLCEVLGLEPQRMFHLEVAFAGRLRLIQEGEGNAAHLRLVFPTEHRR